jgi:hypothetical protein
MVDLTPRKILVGATIPTVNTPLLGEVSLVLNWEMYINPTGEYHYGCISGTTVPYLPSLCTVV